MMEIFNQFTSDMETYSASWVPIWVNVLGAILALSLPFSLVRSEARLILFAFLIGIVLTIGAYAHFGFSRILGIGHVIAWTPVVLYLLANRRNWRVGSTIIGKWLVLAVGVMIISLAFDFADVVRWFLGERAPIGGAPAR